MTSVNAANTIDPFEVRKLYAYLRIADVADALDGIGYFNIGLVDKDIRPLCNGIRFIFDIELSPALSSWRTLPSGCSYSSTSRSQI